MFKRSKKVEEPKFTTAYDSAREHLGPAFDSAKETGSHAFQAALAAMIPVVAAAAPVMAAAKAKGSDLVNSETAHEAKARAALMLAAAKGEPVSVGKKRRWRLAVMFFAFGSAVGAAIAMFAERMRMATEEYDDTHAGPNVNLSQPLTENEPQPVNVLPDVTDTESRSEYSDPKATF